MSIRLIRSKKYVYTVWACFLVSALRVDARGFLKFCQVAILAARPAQRTGTVTMRPMPFPSRIVCTSLTACRNFKSVLRQPPLLPGSDDSEFVRRPPWRRCLHVAPLPMQVAPLPAWAAAHGLMKTCYNLLFSSRYWRDTMQDNNLVYSMCDLTIILNFAVMPPSRTRTQLF